MTDLLTMSRNDAVRLSSNLHGSRRRLVAIIASVKRKRSWSASQKAMSIACYTRELNELIELQEAFDKYHHIKGY